VYLGYPVENKLANVVTIIINKNELYVDRYLIFFRCVKSNKTTHKRKKENEVYLLNGTLKMSRKTEDTPHNIIPTGIART